MRKAGRLCLGSATIVMALLGAPALAQDGGAPEAAGAPAPAAASAPSADAALGDIVVTARRREETAQSVPIALTAIGGAQLAQRNLIDLKQVQEQVPSLTITAVNPNNTNVNIRGLGANALFSNVGLENGVGVHVDGIYFARPGQSTFDLVDLDRIEILRGPQGTLFGKNTTAGAINIITRKPSFTPRAMVEGTVGSHSDFRGRVSLSGGLTDTIAAGITLSETQHGGYGRNVITGKRVNDYDDATLRGQILFKPSDAFSLRVIADYDRQKDACCYQVLANTFTATVGGGSLPRPLAARAAAAGYTLLPVDPFARRSDANTDQRVLMTQYGFTGEATYDFGGATLTSLTGWHKWTYDPRVDADGIGLSIFSAAQQVIDDRQFSQELRLASNGHRAIDWVGGLYLYDHRVHVDQLTQYGSDAPLYVLGADSAVNRAALSGLTVNGISDLKARSYAAFGQATWNISQKLSFTAGLRYNDERKRGAFSQNIDGSPAITGLSPADTATAQAIRNSFGAPAGYTAQTRERRFTGQANIAYRFTPAVMAYATYARGSQSGGINLANLAAGASPTVAPETVDHFELGFKSTLLDRRATFNVALFNTTIGDYQTTILAPNLSTNYLANGGKVRSRGAEVEARFQPVRAINLYASGTFADATFLSYKDAPCPPEYFGTGIAVCDLSGRQIPGAPKWSFAAGGDVTVPLSDRIKGYGGLDWSYKSSFNSSSNLSRYTVVRGYSLVNARIGVRLADDRVDIQGWVRNLFDRHYFQSLTVAGFNAGQINGFVGDPRVFGLTVRAHY